MAKQNEEIADLFWNNVYTLIAKQRTSLRELGDFCGVRSTTIASAKSVSATPNIKLAFNIAKFFGTTIEYLLTDNAKVQTDKNAEVEMVADYVKIARKDKNILSLLYSIPKLTDSQFEMVKMLIESYGYSFDDNV